MSPGLALAPTLSPRRYQSQTPRLSRPRSRRALSQAPALAAEGFWAALLPPPRDKRGAWHRRAGFGSQEGRGTAGTVRLAGWVGRAGRTPNLQQPLSTWVSAAAPARAGTPGPSTCLLWAPGDGRRLTVPQRGWPRGGHCAVGSAPPWAPGGELSPGTRRGERG